MIQLSANSPILLATQPADFRRGIDGMVAVCRQHLAQDPRSGTLFVFINRARTMVRVLVYEGNGFWLMTKRLSKGKFIGWPSGSDPVSGLEARRLRQLLAGKDPTSLPASQFQPLALTHE